MDNSIARSVLGLGHDTPQIASQHGVCIAYTPAYERIYIYQKERTQKKRWLTDAIISAQIRFTNRTLLTHLDLNFAIFQ